MDGQLALVITPDTDAYIHSDPAVVEFNLDGIDVGICSHTYGTDTLLAIASSMR